MSEEQNLNLEEENVIVLRTPGGEEIEFFEIAVIHLDDGVYVILQPKVLLDGMEEDEALVFELEPESEKLSAVMDDELIDRVFEEYYRLLETMA